MKLKQSFDLHHPSNDRSVRDRHMMTSTTFAVEVEKAYQMYCTKIEGLGMTMSALDQIKEGGVNGYVHMLPTRSEIGKVKIHKGLVVHDLLWRWFYEEVVLGIYEPRTVRIHALENVRQLGAKRERLSTWVLERALPIEWQGPQFDVTMGSESRAVQTLTFICDRIKWDLSSVPSNLHFGDAPA